MAKDPPNLVVYFDEDAQKEYERLEKAHRASFARKLKKLATRREQPSPKNALHGFGPGYYKIKLRKAGLRLVYHYDGKRLRIIVIAVGKRERNIVYEAVRARLEGRL